MPVGLVRRRSIRSATIGKTTTSMVGRRKTQVVVRDSVGLLTELMRSACTTCTATCRGMVPGLVRRQMV